MRFFQCGFTSSSFSNIFSLFFLSYHQGLFPQRSMKSCTYAILHSFHLSAIKSINASTVIQGVLCAHLECHHRQISIKETLILQLCFMPSSHPILISATLSISFNSKTSIHSELGEAESSTGPHHPHPLNSLHKKSLQVGSCNISVSRSYPVSGQV